MTNQKTEYLNTVDVTSYGYVMWGADAILFSVQLQLWAFYDFQEREVERRLQRSVFMVS